MRKTILCFICVLSLLFGATSALADTGDTQTVTVPVTLTVAHSAKHINVTLPAALPVSVLDGKVITADNLKIQVHTDSVAVQVASVEVTNGKFSVVSYQNFSEANRNQIALSINGCPTKGPGLLTLTSSSFPTIAAGSSLALRYSAKVNAVSDVSSINAANVIFTLRAA